MKQQRILGYDALRVVAMLAVVGIHACMTARGFISDGVGGASVGSGRAVASLDEVLHFAVPLLVFLSGVLVWGRTWKHEPGRYGQFMKRRLTRIGAPYLAWFAIYAIVAYLLPPTRTGWLQGVAAAPASLWQLLARLLSGNIWYHLYFIPMILTFAALTPLADRLLRWKAWCPEALFVIALAMKVMLFPVISPYVRATLGVDVWAYATHLFVHLPHMALGAVFSMRWNALVGTPSEHTSGKGGSVGVRQSMPALVFPRIKTWLSALKYPLILLIATVVALRLEPLWKRIEKPLSKLAALSFGAYFVHPLFLVAAQAVYPTSDRWQSSSWTLWLNLKFVLALWLGLTVLSFATAAVLARFRATQWLIGE